MKLRGVVGGVLLASLIAAGCGDDGGEEQTADTTAVTVDSGQEEAAGREGGELESETIRVAFASEPDFTQVSNFRWLDQLREQDGLEVEELYFESSQDAFRALIAGEADVAVGTILSAISLVQEAGESVKLIAADLKATDYLLISTPEIESLEDLRGQKVGISTPGDVSDTLTRVVLKREGVDPAEVQFLQIGGTSARMSGLLENQIAAGAAHAAEGLTAVEQGLKNLFVYGEAVPDYLQHGVIVKDEFIDANPNLTQLMVDRFIDSTRWAAENREEYIELSKEKVEGPSDAARDEAYEIFLDIDMFAVNGGMDDAILENTVAIEQEVGTLGEDVPAIDEWADATFVEHYLEENGEL